MIKSRLSYLKWMAVVAVLAMTFIPATRRSTAKSQPSPATTAALEADFRNEERIIGKYVDDLFAFDKQSAELGKRARLVSSDLDPLVRKSEDLQSQLSEIQNTVREVVRKLKAANEWDDLDNSVAARITDGTSNTLFKQSSFKQALEEASNGLASRKHEVSIPLDNLRKRLTSRYTGGADLQIVRAAYEVAAPVFFVSMRCTMAQIRAGLIHKLHGTETCAAQDAHSCACNPDKHGGICSGANCPGAAVN